MATRSKLSRIEKRKRLDALFDRGAYVRFNSDADGRPVIEPETHDESDMLIWVAPPSPFQREMAVREAQASRARTMIDARDNEDSTTWVTIHNYIRQLTTNVLIDYVLDLDDTEYLTQARRDVLQQKDWEDFNALRDAMRAYEEAGSPVGDPEWESLLERDRKFGQQVLERAEEVKDDARAGYLHMPRGKVEEIALEKRIEQAGSAAFMSAYQEWLRFYACRDDEDHLALYFDAPDDIKKLPQPVQDALSAKLGEFITDSAEAKN